MAPAFAIALVALVLLYVARVPLLNAYESAMYRLFPSAARAYAYGERHFNATNPQEYDIVRASYYFNESARIDPQYGAVYHELGRIQFLKGNYISALRLINRQIELHGDQVPNAYYMRGLIEGYMGRYGDAVKDYGYFLQRDPNNWAAINDYSWVLLKAGRPSDALAATDKGLVIFPSNPWLLNSNSIALYELKRYGEALSQAQAAARNFSSVTRAEWLGAYPGNDP
ncbi:MAG: tetratricopeptide repeat protein, partial [Candidatus Kaiserbacteria bacterium]|nr:tetratricopeptide repeat protein [Candidatus Kaiserbacteria bacterium]